MGPRHSTFIGYPTDHMLAVFADPTDAARAAAAVSQVGGSDAEVQVLRGAEGARRLDGTGASHGRVARTRRLVSFTLMDAVLTRLREHGGHFINYYGRFATEELARWSGPEPELPSLLKR